MSAARSLLDGGSKARTAAVYAAILALGTALFFFLHWVGNFTPYETVRQRLEYEVAVNSGPWDERYFNGAKNLFKNDFPALRSWRWLAVAVTVRNITR